MPPSPVSTVRCQEQKWPHEGGGRGAEILSLAKRPPFMALTVYETSYSREPFSERDRDRESGQGAALNKLATSQNCRGSDFYECLTLNLGLFSRCRIFGQGASPRGTDLIQRLCSQCHSTRAGRHCIVRVNSGNLQKCNHQQIPQCVAQHQHNYNLIYSKEETIMQGQVASANRYGSCYCSVR